MSKRSQKRGSKRCGSQSLFKTRRNARNAQRPHLRPTIESILLKLSGQWRMEIWNQSSTLDWREAMWIAGERTNPPTVACDHAQLCTDFLLEFFVAGSAWSIFCLQDPANAPGKCQLAVYQGHQEPPQEILQQVSFFIRGCLLLRCICWANLREVAVLDMIDAVWMLGTHQSLTSWN